MDDKMDMKQMQ